MDWPLSREEKKYHIMQLYDRELQAMAVPSSSSEPAMRKPRDSREGMYAPRLSDASTADSERAYAAHSPPGFGTDYLHAINEKLDVCTHQWRLSRDGRSSVCDESSVQAQSAAEILRQAVADAAKVLRGIEHRSSVKASPQSCHRKLESSSTMRRCVSEEASQSSMRRHSSGRREGQRHVPRGSRSAAESRCGTPRSYHVDSDGDEGDTEDMATTASARRRRISLPRNEDKATPQARSKSMPPAMESLDSFLGEDIPECPF